MKMFAVAVAACWVLTFAARSYGQSPVPSPPPLPSDGSPTASILFPDGRTLPMVSQDGKFPLVIGYAGQTVSVQCRISAALLARLIIQPLDGGTLTTLPPAADGTTLLQFQAGTQPGLYRILVILGDRSVTLQFWVPIPNDDNPPVLTP
jgi:hypothetical protein